MNHRTPAQLAPAAAAAAPANSSASIWLKNLGIVFAGTLFVAACAHVSLPLYFTPVPLSLQPFAVMLLGLLLAPRLAAGTMLAYLAEGAASLPVFAPGVAGVSFIHLFGPTGGYLLSYPLAIALISWMLRRSSRSFTWALASAAVGSIVILSCGAIWLGFLTHASPRNLLVEAVLPFLPGDALKVAAAAALATAWQRLRRPSQSNP